MAPAAAHSPGSQGDGANPAEHSLAECSVEMASSAAGVISTAFTFDYMFRFAILFHVESGGGRVGEPFHLIKKMNCISQEQTGGKAVFRVFLSAGPRQ